MNSSRFFSVALGKSLEKNIRALDLTPNKEKKCETHLTRKIREKVGHFKYSQLSTHTNNAAAMSFRFQSLCSSFNEDKYKYNKSVALAHMCRSNFTTTNTNYAVIMTFVFIFPFNRTFQFWIRIYNKSVALAHSRCSYIQWSPVR